MFFIAHLLSTVLTAVDFAHFRGLTQVAFIRGHLTAGFAFVCCHDWLLILPGTQAILLNALHGMGLYIRGCRLHRQLTRTHAPESLRKP